MATTEAYRTDDLSLATVLAMAGFEYVLEKVTSRKILWVFKYPSEKVDDFDDILDEYNEWEYKVNARAFILKHAEMRNEIFKAIQPHRPSGAPSPATT